MKYKEWLSVWLTNYIQTSSKQRTYERYKQIVMLHIVPHLGEYELSEITPIVLQKFVSDLTLCNNKKTNRSLSANYVKSIVSVVQNSLRCAHSLGILAHYTADNVKCPKSAEKNVECFTAAEQNKMQKYIASSKKPKLQGIVICLYTGLRIGELLALTWEDVDFAKKTLNICKSCHDGYVNGKHCLIQDTPKTPNSVRQIPLPAPLVAMLKTLKKSAKSNFVVSYNGKPILVRSYQRTFELLLKKLNIPHKGFHSLRHTFATRALECGMDVKTLSEILGHKNATITLNRYAHSLWEHKANMMNKLGKLM